MSRPNSIRRSRELVMSLRNAASATKRAAEIVDSPKMQDDFLRESMRLGKLADKIENEVFEEKIFNPIMGIISSWS